MGLWQMIEPLGYLEQVAAKDIELTLYEHTNGED